MGPRALFGPWPQLEPSHPSECLQGPGLPSPHALHAPHAPHTPHAPRLEDVWACRLPSTTLQGTGWGGGEMSKPLLSLLPHPLQSHSPHGQRSRWCLPALTRIKSGHFIHPPPCRVEPDSHGDCNFRTPSPRGALSVGGRGRERGPTGQGEGQGREEALVHLDPMRCHF